MYESITGMKFDHIGIVVKSIEEAVGDYLEFRGMNQHPKIDFVSSQGVRIALIKEGTVNIEFVEPIDKNSKVYNYMQSHPYGGLHHLCYRVDDIDKAYERLKKQLKCIVPKCKGHFGYSVAFYLFRDTRCGFRIVELMENK